MSLTNLDTREVARICALIEDVYGLVFDEFIPIDDDTFTELSAEIGASVSEDAFRSFKRCFTAEDGSGERYFKVTGKDDFQKLLDSEANN